MTVAIKSLFVIIADYLGCKDTNFMRNGKNKLSNSSTAATWIFSVLTQYKFLDDGATVVNDADEVGAGGPSADVDGDCLIV